VSTSDPVSFADLAKQAFKKIPWTDENLAFYALYNKNFAARVSILAGRIALSDEFIDPNDGPLTQDRGHLIGSFVFDAAHEEFYGRGGHKDKPESRVTHRCLAQHLIRCLKPDADKLRALQKKAKPIIDQIDGNYKAGLHFALGFHLGSERLASFEFSELEKQLAVVRPSEGDRPARLQRDDLGPRPQRARGRGGGRARGQGDDRL
jgi:hypothetical protein